MNVRRIKYVFAVLMLITAIISTAQSPINKIDNYGYTWVSAQECLVLKNGNIITTGTTGSNEHQQQSFHFTQLDTNGEVLHSQFYYSPSEYYFIWNKASTIQINDSLVLYCYDSNDSQCFYYNTNTYIIDTIGIIGLRDDSTHVRAQSINYVDSTIVMRCSIHNPNGKDKFSIIKVKDGSVISNTEYDYPEYDINAYHFKSFLSLGANEHYYYISTDLSTSANLIHILDREIVDIYDLEGISTPSAVLASNQTILQPQNYFRTKGDTTFYHVGIINIDLEGNIIWENELEGKMNEVVLKIDDNFLNLWSSTFIDKIIPSAQGDGYIYIGGEYANDSLGNTNGIIGKINLEGEVLWHREYRYDDWDIESDNEFIDIEPDGYGGYILYGTFVGENLETGLYRPTGWLMRVDKDGLLIDTSVNTLDTEAPSYHDLGISPNPAKNTIHLSQSLNQLSVLDINGRLVHQSTDTSQSTLDTSTFSSGIYILIGQGENELWYRSKFVKE